MIIHLIQEIQEKITGRNQIRYGQNGAGIVVRRDQKVCRVRIADYHIAAAEASLFFPASIAQTFGVRLYRSTKGFLLFPGFPHRKQSQYIHRNRQHSLSPFFQTTSKTPSIHKDRGRKIRGTTSNSEVSHKTPLTASNNASRSFGRTRPPLLMLSGRPLQEVFRRFSPLPCTVPAAL